MSEPPPPFTPGSAPRPVSALGLIVPVDPLRRVEVREVTLTASALSDAIGGGLLDDALHASYAGDGYTIYLDDDRVARALPLNDRAAILCARLGAVERSWLAALRGDVLVLGSDPDRNDEDVPRAVLDAARSAGLMPGHRPTFLTQGPPGGFW